MERSLAEIRKGGKGAVRTPAPRDPAVQNGAPGTRQRNAEGKKGGHPLPPLDDKDGVLGEIPSVKKGSRGNGRAVRAVGNRIAVYGGALDRL